MATARPGWSRRAQYGLFFSFLAVIAGIIVGLILLILSLVAPQTFERVRGAALDVTGPVTGALHEVTATAEGWSPAPAIIGTPRSQNGELKRERTAMLAADGRGQGDLPGEPPAQGRRCSCASTSATTVAVGRIVGSSFNSPRRFAILSAGTQRRGAHRHAGALARRPGRPDHRRRRARLARPAGFRPRQHRPRAAAARAASR